MNAAVSECLRWSSAIKPFLASSASRRSLIAISVGHFMSTPPSSVGKVCVGSPSMAPPDSTPRLREHHPHSLNEQVMWWAFAYDEFAHMYLLESAPSGSSSKANSS